MNTSWMTTGNCAGVDPDVFFPHDGRGVEVAKKVCEGCPSVEPCLEYALVNRIHHGVWGGCSERARRKIWKQRRIAVQAEAAQTTNG